MHLRPTVGTPARSRFAAAVGVAALTLTCGVGTAAASSTGTSTGAALAPAVPQTSSLLRQLAERSHAGTTPARLTGRPTQAEAHASTRAGVRAAVGQVGPSLSSGGTLAPGDRLTAGRWSLVMDPDGRLLLEKAANALAAPYDLILTSGPAGSRLVVQGDGNVVLYGPDDVAYDSTRTGGSDGQELRVQEDGNVVLYGQAGHVAFSFDTADPSELYQGGTLLPGERLSSGDGTSLVMQTDGNLVLYTRGGARWASSTGTPGSGMVVQGDGNVVVYAPDLHPLFSTWTRQPAGRQDDEVVLDVFDGEWDLSTLDGPLLGLFGSLWGTSSIESGAALVRGERRVAPGGVLLVLQEDGNLVEYVNGVARFATRTQADFALMQPDGNFVLYRFNADDDLVPAFDTRSGRNPGSRLVVQSDANLVVYTPAGRAVYASRR